MGLGKTIMVLALLDARRGTWDDTGNTRRPSLIVVPRSLVDNWQAEAGRFTPDLRVLDSSHAQRTVADGVTYEYLDGKAKRRAATVERFQTDPTVSLFLISLKAGGVGLNLTAPTTCSCSTRGRTRLLA